MHEYNLHKLVSILLVKENLLLKLEIFAQSDTFPSDCSTDGLQQTNSLQKQATVLKLLCHGTAEKCQWQATQQDITLLQLQNCCYKWLSCKGKIICNENENTSRFMYLV